MKVIYSKFTRERVPRFQQETTIFIDDSGRKKVNKRALKKEGQEHIQNMYKNYIRFRENGCSYFLECECKDTGISFPFVEGESLYEKMVTEVRKRNKEGFLKILLQYMEIAEQCLYEKVPFKEETEFQEIFGDGAQMEGMDSSRYFDVDLTFDNIIIEKNGAIKIIDYEWMFDCLVPVKFAVYRAMFAFYLKHGGQLVNIITEDEYYEYANITREMRVLFARMNDKMMNFIMGTDKVNQQYQKKVQMFSQMTKEENIFSQIFVDTEDGYTESSSAIYPVNHSDMHKRIILNLEKYDNLKSVRIDPLNTACTVQLNQIYLETESGRKDIKPSEILTNADGVYNNHFEFSGEDPQIIIGNLNNEKWKSITVDFYILQYKNSEGDIKISEGHVSEILQTLNQQNEYIRQLKAKMRYIENTKIYGLLLKDKVNKIKDWDTLDM